MSVSVTVDSSCHFSVCTVVCECVCVGGCVCACGPQVLPFWGHVFSHLVLSVHVHRFLYCQCTVKVSLLHVHGCFHVKLLHMIEVDQQYGHSMEVASCSLGAGTVWRAILIFNAHVKTCETLAQCSQDELGRLQSMEKQWKMCKNGENVLI